jgi:hypothetical protein
MKTRLAAVLGLLLSLAASPAMAAGPMELPRDLQELLPADPAILLTCSSLEELDAHWNEIRESFADEDDEEEVSDARSWMREEFPFFDAAVDLTRPVAVALDMGPAIMGQAPYFTFVMPLKPDFTDRATLLEDDDETTVFIQGDYMAVHSGDGYQPAGRMPAIAQDMVPGVMNAVIDLEGLLLTYRPFVEMGLAVIPVGIATTDTMPDGSVVEDPGMTQAEADALAAMIRALMDSLDRMDMGLGATGGQIRFDTRLTTLPDSPLSPGPMPDFDQALALSGLLPEGGDFLMAIAMDMTPQFDLFKDFYLLNARREGEKLGAEKGAKYAAWFEDYVGMIDLWSKPLAGSYGLSTDGMVAHAAMLSDDAPADADRLVRLIEGLSDVELGVDLTPLPGAVVDGVEVRSWKIDVDPETMTGIGGNVVDPQLSAMGRMQAEQLSAMMKRIVPGLSIATRGNHVLVAADDDPAAMAGMIAAAGKGQTRPHAALARAAQAAGPGVQEVVTGDLMAVLNWVSGFMEEAGDEDREIIEDNPIPFDGVYTIVGQKYGFAMNMDMIALKNLIRAIDEMDLDEAIEGYSDENEEEIREELEESEEG